MHFGIVVSQAELMYLQMGKYTIFNLTRVAQAYFEIYDFKFCTISL